MKNDLKIFQNKQTEIKMIKDENIKIKNEINIFKRQNEKKTINDLKASQVEQMNTKIKIIREENDKMK